MSNQARIALEAGCKALVTGGVGYVGARLVDALLARGVEVVVWTRTLAARAIVPGPVRVLAADLADAAAVRALPGEAFDVVFHLAGNADFVGSIERPYEDFLDNAAATVNVLEFARRFSPKGRFVFASSAHVYGEGSGDPIHESMGGEPVSPYGASKSCAELYVRLYARIYGMRTTIVRLFSLFGPGQRRYVVYDFMRKLSADPRVLRIHGDGSQVRDLNYIDNVIDALICVAIRARCDGDVYNVASGMHVSIAELATTLADLMRVTPRLEFSGELAAGAVGRGVADISALQGLGCRNRVALRDGLARTAAWFQAQHGGTTAPTAI